MMLPGVFTRDYGWLDVERAHLGIDEFAHRDHRNSFLQRGSLDHVDIFALLLELATLLASE
jgi:hypothetical protein